MSIFKKIVTTILFLTISSAYAGTKVEVMAEFKKDAPKLKSHPLNSKKTAYLIGNTFNEEILSKYGDVDKKEKNNRISLTKVGEEPLQCVAFVKAVSNAKSTGEWIRGEKLSPLNSFPRFTVVATFSKDGQYFINNPTPHVGILYQHTPDGIYLLDQNHLDSSYGKTPTGEIAVHFVPFNNNSGPGNASNFYVVEQ